MKKPVQKKNFYTSSRDRMFHFEQMIDWGKLSKVRDVDTDVYRSVLADAAGRITGERIAVRAPEANEQHYVIMDNELVWPDSVRESYRELKESGLLCTGVSEEHGGFGLPNVMTAMVSEMMFQADAGFSTIPLLQSGVAEMIELFGSEELKSEYLPKMVSEGYTGAMDLTEAGAGSGLGGIVTKVTEQDGCYRVEGVKQFITNPDPDLHLVLARDADSAQETKGSTKGLSMILVPKIINGKGNSIVLGGLEDKLGIQSSPTGEVVFDNAVGFLVGEKGNGFKQMLKLMNEARRGVAGQGVGLIQASLNDAKEYAAERMQFGKPIVGFGMVAQMLAEMEVYVQAIRALNYAAAFAADMERGLRSKVANAPELKDELKRYSNQALLLTPLVKYYAAERAIGLTRLGIQVHGGVGFTKDYHVERYFRDSVITSIYEGTSEIQAGLFLTEVIKGESGIGKGSLSDLLEDLDLGSVSDPELGKLGGKVRQATSLAGKSARMLHSYMVKAMSSGMDLEHAGNVLSVHAKSLAEMACDAYCSYLLVKQAEKSEDKLPVARVFVNKMLPRVKAYSKEISQVDEQLLQDYKRIVECW